MFPAFREQPVVFAFVFLTVVSVSLMPGLFSYNKWSFASFWFSVWSVPSSSFQGPELINLWAIVIAPISLESNSDDK